MYAQSGFGRIQIWGWIFFFSGSVGTVGLEKIRTHLFEFVQISELTQTCSFKDDSGSTRLSLMPLHKATGFIVVLWSLTPFNWLMGYIINHGLLIFSNLNFQLLLTFLSNKVCESIFSYIHLYSFA